MFITKEVFPGSEATLILPLNWFSTISLTRLRPKPLFISPVSKFIFVENPGSNISKISSESIPGPLSLIKIE